MNQLIAGGEGALDSVTFGFDDKAYAALGALADGIRGKSVNNSYDARIAYERARDRYYAQHYGTARTIGEIGGAVLPIPGLGPVGLLAKELGRTARFADAAKLVAQGAKIGERIKQVTPLATHERAVVSGLGAAAGGVGQIYSDAGRGHPSSGRDLVSAMAGGALQAQLALQGRPMLAGATGGAATSMLQDALNGRSVSIGNAAEAADVGAAAGKLGDLIGRGRFYYGAKDGKGNLGRYKYGAKDKGDTGEALSKFRTYANIDVPLKGKRRFYLDRGGYTVPDHDTLSGQRVEAKAGLAVRLSKPQNQARSQLGAKYRVDHLLPQDVGSLFGFVGSQIGYRLPDYMQPDPQDQQR